MSTPVAPRSAGLGPVCGECKSMLRYILNAAKPTDGWHVTESSYATIGYTSSHHEGDLEMLKVCAKGGCSLCHLILLKITHLHDIVARRSTESTKAAQQESGEHPVADRYSVFTDQRNLQLGEFALTIHDIHSRLGIATGLPPVEIVCIVRREVQSSLFSDLGLVDDPGTLDWMQLPRISSASLDTEMDFAQIQAWLTDCRNNHPDCAQRRLLHPEMPTRVVDIGESQGMGVNSELEFVAMREFSPGERADYVSVSYSWGKGTRLMHYINVQKDGFQPRWAEALTSDHIVERKIWVGGAFVLTGHCTPEKIPVSWFPRLFHDAFRICRRLGVRFVWIDSLCIVQNDGPDWTLQLGRMSDIYGGALFTISATGNAVLQGRTGNQTSDDTIFASASTDDKVALGSAQSGQTSNQSPTVEIYAGDSLQVLDLEDKYLATRGWVFQERLSAVATLHYTDEGKLWECLNSLVVDHDQDVSQDLWKSSWTSLLHLQHGKPEHFWKHWKTWVAAYSERDLYFVTDKFDAFAGILRPFATALRLPIDSFAAGLWKQDFLAGLSWRRFPSTATLVRDDSVAPSWSWASVTGRLEYKTRVFKAPHFRKFALEVVQYDVKKLQSPAGSEIWEGGVIVHGAVQEIKIDRKIDPGVRGGRYGECGVCHGFVNNTNVLCTLDEWPSLSHESDTFSCLHIGSYDSANRDGDVYLLLSRVQGQVKTFRRVGLAETLPWFIPLSTLTDSGIFLNPERITVTLI